jgi:predicted permease
VVLFTVGTTLVAALAAGLTPALAASRTDLATTLKEESLTSTGRRSRLRRALVIAQVSLSLVLLVAGALFIRTLTRTDLTRPGFEPNGVHVVSLDFFMAGFDEAEGRRFAAAMLNRVAPLPGVESASLAHDLPLDLNAFSLDDITLDGKTGPDGTSSFTSEWNIVSPGFFRTIRLPLLRGRDFTEADSAGAPAVAIINQTMAERFWPGDDPVGKRFYRGPAVSDNVIEVIGVAANTDNRVVGGRPIPFIYVPLNQTYIPRNSLLVRSNNQADAIPLVRNVLREMNPNLPVIRVRSLNQVIGFSLLPQRVAASIIGSMGLVGLLLASIGIYAVTAHAVSSRIREIGIRVALGARPQRVVRLMLREGLMLAAAGLVLGLIGAVAAGQIVRSYLYSIGPTDLIAFAGATITLVTVVLLASYIPAHRATKVDAMAALRHK